MRWRGRRGSDNIVDRRGASGRSGRFGMPRFGRGMGSGMESGRRGGFPIGRRGGGIGIVGLLVIVAIMVISGLESGTEGPAGGMQAGTTGAADQQLAEFSAVVLADTEDIWHSLFNAQLGRDYSEPKMVLFSRATGSGCGPARAEIGPFYCPPDQAIYLDLRFFAALRDRFAAPGDFAQAYVIAHEVGHHVQTLLGISQQVHAARERLSAAEYNRQSVRLELQADCLAGVWAHHADRMIGVVEAGDIDEALRAASAIGDDTLQAQAGGGISPESFTHGTSEQRAGWFRNGFESGQVSRCDTFSAPAL